QTARCAEAPRQGEHIVGFQSKGGFWGRMALGLFTQWCRDLTENMPRRFRHTLCIAIISIAIGKSAAEDSTNFTATSKGSYATSNIVSNPQSTNIPVGSSATFSVTASGTPALTYQWYRTGSNVVADTNQLASQTNGSMELTSVQHTNAGQFQVMVTNGSV